MGGLTVAIVLYVKNWLHDTTYHDDLIEVPNLKGYMPTEANDLVSGERLRTIIDDSVYFPNEEPGIVLKQMPTAGDSVKPNRMIYLTVNRTSAPKTVLPALRDLSKRTAISKLNSVGIKIDSVIYKPADCFDCVVDVLYDNLPAERNMQLARGESVTLIVGGGASNETMAIPSLYGLSRRQVIDKLRNLGLYVGLEYYDKTFESLEDSTSTFVIQQSPDTNALNVINIGTSMDVTYTADSTLIK